MNGVTLPGDGVGWYRCYERAWKEGAGGRVNIALGLGHSNGVSMRVSYHVHEATLRPRHRHPHRSTQHTILFDILIDLFLIIRVIAYGNKHLCEDKMWERMGIASGAIP